VATNPKVANTTTPKGGKLVEKMDKVIKRHDMNLELQRLVEPEHFMNEYIELKKETNIMTFEEFYKSKFGDKELFKRIETAVSIPKKHMTTLADFYGVGSTANMGGLRIIAGSHSDVVFLPEFKVQIVWLNRLIYKYAASEAKVIAKDLKVKENAVKLASIQFNCMDRWFYATKREIKHVTMKKILETGMCHIIIYEHFMTNSNQKVIGHTKVSGAGAVLAEIEDSVRKIKKGNQRTTKSGKKGKTTTGGKKVTSGREKASQAGSSSRTDYQVNGEIEEVNFNLNTRPEDEWEEVLFNRVERRKEEEFKESIDEVESDDVEIVNVGVPKVEIISDDSGFDLLAESSSDDESDAAVAAPNQGYRGREFYRNAERYNRFVETKFPDSFKLKTPINALLTDEYYGEAATVLLEKLINKTLGGGADLKSLLSTATILVRQNKILELLDEKQMRLICFHCINERDELENRVVKDQLAEIQRLEYIKNGVLVGEGFFSRAAERLHIFRIRRFGGVFHNKGDQQPHELEKRVATHMAKQIIVSLLIVFVIAIIVIIVGVSVIGAYVLYLNWLMDN